MAAGRFLQGAATGVMLMIMIPMLVLSFPIERRNYALLVLIGGFYGSVIIGTILGTIATSCGHWRWLFFIFGTLSLIGVAVSYFFLHDEHHGAADQEQPLDRAGILYLSSLPQPQRFHSFFCKNGGCHRVMYGLVSG